TVTGTLVNVPPPTESCCVPPTAMMEAVGDALMYARSAAVSGAASTSVTECPTHPHSKSPPTHVAQAENHFSVITELPLLRVQVVAPCIEWIRRRFTITAKPWHQYINVDI